jgi:hypothetical protein
VTFSEIAAIAPEAIQAVLLANADLRQRLEAYGVMRKEIDDMIQSGEAFDMDELTAELEQRYLAHCTTSLPLLLCIMTCYTCIYFYAVPVLVCACKSNEQFDAMNQISMVSRYQGETELNMTHGRTRSHASPPTDDRAILTAVQVQLNATPLMPKGTPQAGHFRGHYHWSLVVSLIRGPGPRCFARSTSSR